MLAESFRISDSRVATKVCQVTFLEIAYPSATTRQRYLVFQPLGKMIERTAFPSVNLGDAFRTEETGFETCVLRRSETNFEGDGTGAAWARLEFMDNEMRERGGKGVRGSAAAEQANSHNRSLECME